MHRQYAGVNDQQVACWRYGIFNGDTESLISCVSLITHEVHRQYAGVNDQQAREREWGSGTK